MFYLAATRIAPFNIISLMRASINAPVIYAVDLTLNIPPNQMDEKMSL